MVVLGSWSIDIDFKGFFQKFVNLKSSPNRIYSRLHPKGRLRRWLRPNPTGSKFLPEIAKINPQQMWGFYFWRP